MYTVRPCYNAVYVLASKNHGNAVQQVNLRITEQKDTGN